MMTRRAVFEEVGGFRNELGYFGDVDYCLRLTAAGYRVVFTPHALFVHTESLDSGTPAVVVEEANRLRTLWADRLARDPYYNVNLSRDTPNYEPDLSYNR